MKIDNLKHKLKKSSTFCITVVAIFGIIFGISFYLKVKADEKVNKLQAERSSVEGMISQKSKIYEDARIDFTKFKLLNKSKYATKTGLAAAHERISSAIPLFEMLKTSYHFAKLNFTVSATNISQRVTSTIYDVYESSVSIEYSGVSDEFVFSFINDLKHLIAGFAEVKSMEMNRVRPLVLNNPAANDVVSGKIDVIWRSLKEKGGAEPASLGSAQMPMGMPQNMIPGAPGNTPK